MQEKELIIFLILSTIAILVVAFGFILLFYFFYQAKKKLLMEQKEAELNFIKEISKTKSEIQDHTLTHISRELHDNVGQLLAVAKIHTNVLSKENSSHKVVEINNAITQCIEEVRNISKSLNSERIQQFGLRESLINEINRIEKLNAITIKSNIEQSKKFEIEGNKQIMLFRIIQEFISNTLKYANATEVSIMIEQNDEHIRVDLSDNGIGYEENKITKGSGLINIENRAQLIGAQLEMSSNLDVGTKLTLTLAKTLPHV